MSAHVTEVAVSESPQADQQFRDELAWIEENRGRYAGRWVALAGKTLLASGDSARDAFEASHRSNEKSLILLVEGETLPFAGW